MGCSKLKTYVADFETTVPKPSDYEVDNDGNADIEVPEVSESTRVWAFGTCEIGNVDNFQYGTSMSEFMSWCRKGNKLIYFHNLKFDGEFIFYWLLTNGFEYSESKEDNTFNCLVSEMGQFYAIEVIFERRNKKYKKVIFQDSLKKLPFPVKKIAKDFGLPIQKLDIDYELDRPVGYKLTDEEIEYLKADVQIVAMALGIQFDQELTKMTVGSDSLYSFKKILGGGNAKRGEKLFLRDFPSIAPRN